MKALPVLTEKTLQDAKDGKYTFWVDRRLNKSQIRKIIGEIFGVTVKKVRTINVSGEMKRTTTGRKRQIKPKKKAIVELEGKDKIDLFEDKK
jgi:large subunit ribosomal protein L23